MVVGTPHYMSPEQAQGFPVDARGDLYSLGATWYCLLAGRPPFAGESAFEIMLQHISTEPPDLAGLRPDLPAAHLRLIRRALAKKPADRFQSAAELVAELERLAAEEETSRARRGRRLRRGMTAVALVLTGLAGASAARHFWLQPAVASDGTVIVQGAGESVPDVAAVPPGGLAESLDEPQATEHAVQGPETLPPPREAPRADPEAPRGAGARLVVRGAAEPTVPVLVAVERQEERETPGGKPGRAGPAGGKGGPFPLPPPPGSRHGHAGHGHR
jgi:serine/threonine-protein kinase